MPESRIKATKHIRNNSFQRLRNQYKKELRSIEASKRTGSGLVDIKVLPLRCFDQLGVLRPFLEKRASHNNIENIPAYEDCLQGVENEASNLNSSVSSELS